MHSLCTWESEVQSCIKKFDTGLPQLEDARAFTSNLHNDQILILVPGIKCDSSKVNPFKGKNIHKEKHYKDTN